MSPAKGEKPGTGSDDAQEGKTGKNLDALGTVVIGVTGMMGVFAGLILLALSMVGLKRVVDRLDAAKARKSPAPPPKNKPAENRHRTLVEPVKVPEAPVPPSPGRTMSGWKIAGSAMASPQTAAWIRPAFRAAFASSDGAGPAKVKISDREYSVEFLSIEGPVARMRVNGRDFTVDLGDLPEGPEFIPADRSAKGQVAPPAAAMPVLPAVPVRTAPGAPSVPAPLSGSTGSTTVRAPIPGTVIEIKAGPGTRVTKGQEIFILEAMKMENKILSPVDGEVREVRVSERAAVRQGDVLALIDPS